MTNSRILLIIFLVWITERLAQSVFLYNFSLAIPLLVSLVFFAVRFKISPWPLFAGGLIFDLSSGLPFGIIALAVITIYLIIILGQRVMNFFDSLPLFLLAAAVLSSIIWVAVIWLSGVPLRIFSDSAALVAVETLLIALIISINGGFKPQQI